MPANGINGRALAYRKFNESAFFGISDAVTQTRNGRDINKDITRRKGVVKMRC